jgi:C-terminal processing protease CtpA/Prc
VKNLFIILFIGATQLVAAQTQRELDNLEAFNRLYGYVRYFHPSDEAASIDWDRFVTYGSREVEKCNSPDELRTKLNQLFLPIAPSIKIFRHGDKVFFSRKELLPVDSSKFKVVSWQHNGLGGGSGQGPYASSRLNRKVIVKSKTNFGTVSYSLDMEPYRNKEFLYTASVKLVEGSGTAQLWARVDRENKKMGFFDNMDSRPIRSTGWQTYEIKGTVDSDAKRLAFGCLLKNTGKLAVDELRLSIREGGEWKSVYYNNFESDKVDEKPKDLSLSPPGYKVLVSEGSASEGTKSVTIESVVTQTDLGLLFPKFCNVGEVAIKNIGSELTVVIPLAVYGNESNTYPAADPAKLSALQDALAGISPNPDQDKYSRLGSLITTWNVFQHFYPYFDVVKTDWSSTFQPAVKEIYANQSGYDFLKTLRRLTAQLQDGHVNVSGPATRDNEDYVAPIQWEWVENKLVITKVYDNSLQISVGDVVGSIDNETPEKYFERVSSYISAATPGWLLYKANTYALMGPKDSKIRLTFPDDRNRDRSVELSRTLPLGEYYGKMRETSKGEPIRLLSENTYYINLNDAPMSAIKEKMPELVKAKALICDLRGYPNGNHELIGHLLERNDTSTRWMRVPQIIYPDQKNIVAYQNHGWAMTPLDPHISAKVYFLVDGRAISYAESYMGFIEHYNLATIIGQPSAGTNGNVNFIYLPGGYQITWTGMKVLKHDGSPLHGVGTTPDVYIQKTVKGIRENRDEFLDKAIELANQYKLKSKD